jgi:hypothetical protein
VPVVRQDFRDSLVPHRSHRNAVGQAVALVGARLVEGEAFKEGLMGLRSDRDIGIAQDVIDEGGRRLMNRPRSPNNARTSAKTSSVVTIVAPCSDWLIARAVP